MRLLEGSHRAGAPREGRPEPRGVAQRFRSESLSADRTWPRECNLPTLCDLRCGRPGGPHAAPDAAHALSGPSRGV
jgi:hypothetical protein